MRDLTEKLTALRKGGGDLVGEPPLGGGGGGFTAGGAVVGVGGRVRQPAMPIMLCNTPCCQYDITIVCRADVEICKGRCGCSLVGRAGGEIMAGGAMAGGAVGGGTMTGAPPMGVAGAPGFCMCTGGGMAGGLGATGGGFGGKWWSLAVRSTATGGLPLAHFGWACMSRGS